MTLEISKRDMTLPNYTGDFTGSNLCDIIISRAMDVKGSVVKGSKKKAAS